MLDFAGTNCADAGCLQISGKQIISRSSSTPSRHNVVCTDRAWHLAFNIFPACPINTIAMLYSCKAQTKDLFSKRSCKMWSSNYDFAVAADILHERLLDANMCHFQPNCCGYTWL